MRRRPVVAIAALIASVALAGLPAPVGSRSPSTARELAPAAFVTVTIPADAPAPTGQGVPADSASASRLARDAALVEPGAAPVAPVTRPRVDQPAAPAGTAWKPARYSLSGYATFYNNGTTAMRLPRGSVVRICGAGGCIERVVNDYGPQKPSRVVDLYEPDFWTICGCPWYSGTTWVTVAVY